MTKKSKKQVVTNAPAAPSVSKSKSPPSKAKPAAPKASSIREITFAVYEPRAEQVFVCGPFNGWSPSATPLTRKENRDWKATIALPPGRHEYKFVVDGKWKPDPRGVETVPNAFGTLNSVVEVKA